MIVGFYGMTHLGLISAAAAAEKGCCVVAYDANNELITNLNKQQYPIEEPYFSETVGRSADRFSFTSDLNELLQADFIYVAIDVPTNHENASDLKPIQKALERLREKLKSGQVVVVLSQVSPGFMRQQRFPEDQLFYQVETLIFGRAMERATKPERFIVGCEHPEKPLPTSYDQFLKKFGCPILKMRYESAELAKIAINMYLVSSVTTSNMLADVAAAIGADWQEVVPTLRLDKRIGEFAYLDPGLGISGGNLERDMSTIEKLAHEFNVPASLIATWKNLSHFYKQWVWRCLELTVFSHLPAPVIAVLGLAYKANTHSIKNSPAIHLLEQLQHTKARIQAHDPAVGEMALNFITRCDSVAKALNSANVLVIMTPWIEYSALKPSELLASMSGRIIVDPYRVLNHHDFTQAGFSIYTLGVNLYSEVERRTIKEDSHV